MGRNLYSGRWRWWGGMAGLLFLVGFGVCDMITNEKKGRLSMKIAK